MKISHTRFSSRNGFTLVEVLVSSALTLIVLSMLFTILIGAMDAWRAGTGRLQGNADARMALDIIASDLQSMVVRQTTYNQEWLVSGQIATPGDPSGRMSNYLLFFAPSLDRDPEQEGDIVAISYRLGYKDPLSDSTDNRYWIFGLYKTMATTLETFTNVLGQQDIRAGYWDNVDTLASEALLIPNVVDFRLVWHGRSTVGNNPPSPAAEDALIQLNNTLRVNGTVQPAVLEAVDISLTLLTDEGAARVQAFAQGGGLNGTTMQNIIREFGRVYTKRVQIEY